MIRKKYNFTSADLKLKRDLEKKRGSKILDEEFYKYILKLRKCLEEYVGAVKRWADEKPWEAEQLSRFVKNLEEKKKNKKIYDKLAKIKKLSIAGLKKLLVVVLKKEGYVNLELSKQEIGKDVIISFTVQDNRIDRGEYDSRILLQRIIKEVLEKTNWRLMSEGIHYHLGILTSRLKGIESEEDLLKIISSNRG